MQFPITAVLIVAYFLSMEAAQSPDGAAAVVGSLFPPTAPMVMIARIAHGGVPWWQIVLSVALMVVTVYGMVQLAGTDLRRRGAPFRASAAPEGGLARRRGMTRGRTGPAACTFEVLASRSEGQPRRRCYGV